jgi:hypothetical protein
MQAEKRFCRMSDQGTVNVLFDLEKVVGSGTGTAPGGENDCRS